MEVGRAPMEKRPMVWYSQVVCKHNELVHETFTEVLTSFLAFARHDTCGASKKRVKSVRAQALLR